METFRKWQNEVIGCFNQNIWLVVDASKVGHGYSKMYVDTCFLVMVSDDQGEAIGKLNQKIHNAYKRHTYYFHFNGLYGTRLAEYVKIDGILCK